LPSTTSAPNAAAVVAANTTFIKEITSDASVISAADALSRAPAAPPSDATVPTAQTTAQHNHNFWPAAASWVHSHAVIVPPRRVHVRQHTN
jgi:hypothetical protein